MPDTELGTVSVAEGQVLNNSLFARRVNVNCNHGWALRRAIRHGHTEVWEAIAASPGAAISSANTHGFTALHTAARCWVSNIDPLMNSSQVWSG